MLLLVLSQFQCVQVTCVVEEGANVRFSNRRPGILVLINEADWELEGEGDYVLKEGDRVLFVSTLHGG